MGARPARTVGRESENRLRDAPTACAIALSNIRSATDGTGLAGEPATRLADCPAETLDAVTECELPHGRSRWQLSIGVLAAVGETSATETNASTNPAIAARSEDNGPSRQGEGQGRRQQEVPHATRCHLTGFPRGCPTTVPPNKTLEPTAKSAPGAVGIQALSWGRQLGRRGGSTLCYAHGGNRAMPRAI